MRKSYISHSANVCILSTFGMQSCGLPVQSTSGYLCTSGMLYTKTISTGMRGVHKPLSYTRLVPGFSPASSTGFYAIFHLLQTRLYTVSTSPITTRVFLKNHIFISKQGALEL